MTTRKIKDAKDLSTQELIYFKGHAKATFMSDGKTVEDVVNDKQDVLISGTNVKTINGHSILGKGNIVLEGGGGGVAGGGIYEIKYDYLNGTPLSGEDIAFNKEVFDRLNNNEVSALYVTISIDNTPINIIADSFVYTQTPLDETPISCVYLNFNSDTLLVFGLSKKTVGILSTGQCVEMPIANNIVDDEMSDTSENAVQNKVITEELNNKVDKVSGKQLSTEDFTTALKTKLEGMNSFDPTEINNKVNGLQTQVDTLVNGDASAAIESFNEITAFLNGVEDTNSLKGIIAGIEQQITNKQDTIADLETIRSGAALGATALQEHQDISHLATKLEVNSKQDTLVSGTNIKTINGESILGEGNLTIQGGNGSYDDTEIREELSKKADKTYVDNAIAQAITLTLNTEV